MMSQFISTDCIVLPNIEEADNVFKMEPESEIDEVIKLDESEDPVIKVDSCRLRNIRDDELDVFSIAKIENMDYGRSSEDRPADRECSNDNLKGSYNDEEKLYKSEMCKKTFKCSNELASHKLVHIDEGPQECNFCKTSFSSRSRFSRHKCAHTGEKPYECDVCNKSFS